MNQFEPEIKANQKQLHLNRTATLFMRSGHRTGTMDLRTRELVDNTDESIAQLKEWSATLMGANDLYRDFRRRG